LSRVTLPHFVTHLNGSNIHKTDWVRTGFFWLWIATSVLDMAFEDVVMDLQLPLGAGGISWPSESLLASLKGRYISAQPGVNNPFRICIVLCLFFPVVISSSCRHSSLRIQAAARCASHHSDRNCGMYTLYHKQYTRPYTHV
jgi:hypothetical protein